MKSKIILTFLIFIFTNEIISQIGISESNIAPNPSAMLDVSSTTKGFLAPRMTTAQRETISPPTSGLLVFDTSTKSYWYTSSINAISGTFYNNWVEIPNKPLWEKNGIGGNEIKNTNVGGFWSKNAITMGFNMPDVPTAPTSGEGTRLMWLPTRSAFRAGTIDADHAEYWDANNIGIHSFATGFNNKASGVMAIALGSYNIVNGYLSAAFGINNTINGNSAIAIGSTNITSGENSKAFGNNSLSSGLNAIAIGEAAHSTGTNSIAIGSSSSSGLNSITLGNGGRAYGENTVSIGYNSEASGKNSIAIGDRANTNVRTSSIALSGIPFSSPQRAICDKDYQMKMHFDEYQFLTGTSKDFTISDGKISTNNSMHITGTTNYFPAGYAYLGNVSPVTGYYGEAANNPYSIYASSRILAQEFDAYSDARHKKLQTISNGKSDLEKLNQLKVSNYTFIDTVGKSDKIQMGFIAQQVEQIVPEAVNKIIDYIPNVYEMAKTITFDSLAHTLTVYTIKAHDFADNDEIKLISQHKEHKVKVAKVLNTTTFTINNWEKPIEKLFVFGKQVTDFRTVDYDRLFTLGISAIQELSRQIKDLQKEITDLKTKNELDRK
jgi:Chaperone of endosialidase/Head domain of trimeric autotransporter adhesin